MATAGLQFDVSADMAVTSALTLMSGPKLLRSYNYKNQVNLSFNVGILFKLKEKKN